MTELKYNGRIGNSAPGAVLAKSSIESLQARLQGELLQPGDDDYDSVRMVWNGLIDRKPLLIVRCAAPSDVINAVNFARTHHLLLSVRGGRP